MIESTFGEEIDGLFEIEPVHQNFNENRPVEAQPLSKNLSFSYTNQHGSLPNRQMYNPINRNQPFIDSINQNNLTRGPTNFLGALEPSNFIPSNSNHNPETRQVPQIHQNLLNHVQIHTTQNQPQNHLQSSPQAVPPKVAMPQPEAEGQKVSGSNLAENGQTKLVQGQSNSSVQNSRPLDECALVMHAIRQHKAKKEPIPQEFICKVFDSLNFTKENVEEVINMKEGKREIRKRVHNLKQKSLRNL